MHRSSFFGLPRRRSPFAAPFALGLGLTCLCRPAHAEVSSWASVASGPIWLDQGSGNGLELVPALSMQTGMGSTPALPIIVGGLFHVQTHFGEGTDFGLLARVATQGFVLGDWGAALDLGGYLRAWGVRSEGALANLSLGGPWGVTLTASGGLGTHDTRQFGVMLGIDFARMTVYRTTGQSWFPNPYPGYSAQK